MGLNFGGPNGFPQGRTDTTFVLSDTAQLDCAGRHALKFGGEYRRFHNVNFQNNGGTFTYPEPRRLPGRARQRLHRDARRHRRATSRSRRSALFVQDNFKAAARNLSLELGLRYDLNVAPTEADDRFVYFDPATVSLVPGRARAGRDTIYGNKNNFQPRVGLVWDPFEDGKTSVRAAYAILSDQPVTNLVTPTAAQPAPRDAAHLHGPAGRSASTTRWRWPGPAGLAPGSVDAGFRNPRIQTWNLNVQREIWRTLGADGRLLRLEGRPPARVAQRQPDRSNGVRPYPRLSATSPILPGSALGNITEVTSLG